jgi:hypothetical protein
VNKLGSKENIFEQIESDDYKSWKKERVTRRYQIYLADNYYWEELIKDLPDPVTPPLLEQRLRKICSENSLFVDSINDINFGEIASIFC